MAGRKNDVKPFSSTDYQRPGLTEDEVQEIKEVFDLFDYSGRGYLSVEDLRREISDILGSQQVLSGIIRQADMDGSGRLNFDEFLHLVLSMKTADDRTRRDFKSVFGLFYEDRNGLNFDRDLCVAGREVGEGTSFDYDYDYPVIKLHQGGREVGEGTSFAYDYPVIKLHQGGRELGEGTSSNYRYSDNELEIVPEFSEEAFRAAMQRQHK